MITTDNELNVHLANVLDADLWIIKFLKFQNQLKITKNGERLSVSKKEVIAHRKNNLRTVMRITIRIYMNI